jgi:hypothetical protein
VAKRPRFSVRRKSFKALINPDFLYAVLFGKQMLLPCQFCLGLRRYRELDGQGLQVRPDHGDQPRAADPVKKAPGSHNGPFHCCPRSFVGG